MANSRLTQLCLLAIFLLVPVSYGSENGTPVDIDNQDIPEQFIIGLKDFKNIDDNHATQFAKGLQRDFGVSTIRQLRVDRFRAVLVRIKDPRLVEVVQSLPEVRFVEANKVVQDGMHPACDQVTHESTIWGAQRIQQRSQVVVDWSSHFPYATSADNDGTGVDAYILDTGIRLTHKEFQGRATWGYTAPDVMANGDTAHEDGTGHGTHVAGTIGGATTGVAKNVHLVAVRVLKSKGGGTTADIVSGIGWVVGRHQNKPNAKSVINLSVQYYGVAYAADTAIQAASLAGVVMAVCSGNWHEDACYHSMGRSTYGITVAASDVDDKHASFCNYGPCVDIEAPGVNITSANYKDDVSYQRMSGCSMATPHVTGVIARYLSSLTVTPTPQEVKSWLLDEATKDAIIFTNSLVPVENETGYLILETSTPNRLLYMDCMDLQKDGTLACPRPTTLSTHTTTTTARTTTSSAQRVVIRGALIAMTTVTVLANLMGAIVN